MNKKERKGKERKGKERKGKRNQNENKKERKRKRPAVGAIGLTKVRYKDSGFSPWFLL